MGRDHTYAWLFLLVPCVASQCLPARVSSIAVPAAHCCCLRLTAAATPHRIFAKVAGYVEFVNKRRPVPRQFVVVHPEAKEEAYARIAERVARRKLETIRRSASIGPPPCRSTESLP